MCLKSIKAFIKINYIRIVLPAVLLMGMGNAAYAQLCTGSLGDPVVKINFGAGTATHAGALPAGTTSYNYSSADFPNDGSYTVENSTAGSGNVWWSTTDHTGDAGGYMMVVNASVSKTDYFYKSTVTGLCPGTTFEFAAWITNLLRSSDISPPNITFTISTTTGAVLATYNTGTIPLTPGGRVWKQYGTYFTTPAGVSTVVIQMTNNSNGGAPANDLALDDITFRPCGPVLSSTFGSGASSSITAQGCAGTDQSYTLNATASAGGYTNPTYQWQINTGSAWVNIAGATATSYTVNFQPAVAGVYKYRMVASEAANAGSASCQVASNELTLTIGNAPTAAFTVTNNNSDCLLSTVDFKDLSIGNGQAITSWFWEFGDGETSTDQNPSHTYATAGDRIVRLTVKNSSGACPSVIEQTIHITSKLVANFDADASVCPNSPVTFTDLSTTADAVKNPITQWIWNFDDGSPTLVLTNNAPFTHQFATSGDHAVTLQVVTASKCFSDLFSKTVSVIVADLSICPGEVTQFTDKTVKPGTPGFTFNWNFGDAKATAANPNTSTDQNPTHSYTDPGTYTVSLTVASPNGCAPTTIQKTFTYTGISVAKFDIQNKNNLCSSDSVTFVDQTDATSNISKLVWFYDVDGHPTDSVVYTTATMRSDKKYTHFYGLNNTGAPITYHALLIARIGGPCPDPTYTQDVVINPNPVAVLKVSEITLVSPYTLCQTAAAINITTTADVPGKPTFTGTGITSDGLFDPRISGPGKFTINYIYTADGTGCTFSTNFDIIVNPLPVITLVTTAGVLEGGQTTLNPSVTGSDLKYSWSPATGVSDTTKLNPFFSPAVDTEYTLTVTSAGGCPVSASVLLHVLKTPVVPNAFTPNNDGINDTWYIKYLDTYPNATVEVFNRYGAKVFSSIGYPIPWDGTSKGAELPFGVYYYIIDPKSGAKKMSGSLTIIK